MTIKIPYVNWISELTQAIRNSPNGTVIQVDSEAKKVLSEIAIKRLGRESEITVTMV